VMVLRAVSCRSLRSARVTAVRTMCKFATSAPKSASGRPFKNGGF
jgi:hypothetical protein